MAFTGLQDLSGYSVKQLYDVYMAVAEADWKWRRTAVYGATEPPPGHAMFRPLSFDVFAQRIETAGTMEDGDASLRDRLARQAAAYRVDVVASARTARAA